MTQIESITQNIEYVKKQLEIAKAVKPADEMQKLFKQSNIDAYEKELKDLNFCLEQAINQAFKMKQETCVELATKKNRLIYYNEICGNKSKYKIAYTLKDKRIEKTLCKKHLNSVTAWLNRIKVKWVFDE